MQRSESKDIKNQYGSYSQNNDSDRKINDSDKKTKKIVNKYLMQIDPVTGTLGLTEPGKKIYNRLNSLANKENTNSNVFPKIHTPKQQIEKQFNKPNPSPYANKNGINPKPSIKQKTEPTKPDVENKEKRSMNQKRRLTESTIPIYGINSLLQRENKKTKKPEKTKIGQLCEQFVKKQAEPKKDTCKLLKKIYITSANKKIRPNLKIWENFLKKTYTEN